MIRVTSEQIKIAKKVLKTSEKDVKNVLRHALNRSMRQARTEGARKLRETYYIKYSDLLNAMKITKADEESNAIITKIKVRSTRRELMMFRVSPKDITSTMKRRPKSIKVAVMRTGFKTLPGAFVSKGSSSGKLHILRRTDKKRYPLHIKYGPSIPEMANTPQVREAIEARAKEVFEQRFDHEFRRMLFRRGGGA